MEITEALQQLHDSEEFQAWQSSHQDAYLAHLFSMIEKEGATFQVGYYDPSENMIYSFDVGDKVKAVKPEQPFGPEGTIINELKMDDVKLSMVEALAKVSEVQKDKYPTEAPVKKIIVLQNTMNEGQVYNVTYVTRNFKTLNMKVDANSGEVVFDDLIEIFKFNK